MPKNPLPFKKKVASLHPQKIKRLGEKFFVIIFCELEKWLYLCGV